MQKLNLSLLLRQFLENVGTRVDNHSVLISLQPQFILLYALPQFREYII
jgi:hypothetical protein